MSIEDDRIRAAQRGMRARARTAKAAALAAEHPSAGAALSGKARAYRECADMLEALLRAGTIRRKYE